MAPGRLPAVPRRLPRARQAVRRQAGEASGGSGVPLCRDGRRQRADALRVAAARQPAPHPEGGARAGGSRAADRCEPQAPGREIGAQGDHGHHVPRSVHAPRARALAGADRAAQGAGRRRRARAPPREACARARDRNGPAPARRAKGAAGGGARRARLAVRVPLVPQERRCVGRRGQHPRVRLGRLREMAALTHAPPRRVPKICTFWVAPFQIVREIRGC